MIGTKAFQVPKDLEPAFEFLLELYTWPQYWGAMIFKAESIYGFCEFAKPLNEQREELAVLQYYGAIQSLYKEEYDRLQMTRLGEYLEDSCRNTLTQR